jgi:hypothetical protein
MGVCYNCPYYKKELNDRIRCEFATIKPPDKRTRREFVSEFCASEDNYKNCTFYKLLDEYYERKYRQEFEAMVLKEEQ